MKRLQLPQNKIVRLAISVGVVLFLFWIVYDTELLWQIYRPICAAVDFDTKSWMCFPLQRFMGRFWFWSGHIFIACLIPMRYIWWGRLKLKPRITRSKED